MNEIVNNPMFRLFFDVTAGHAGFNMVAFGVWIWLAIFALGFIVNLRERD